MYPWHQSVWQTLVTARLSDRLPHALLFYGEAGCGNENFVETLAQDFLCLQPDKQSNACGHCRSCQTFMGGAHPDFARIEVAEDKQAIVVDQIRELVYFLGLSRSFSPLRVGLIRQAERMNVNAANSLLKSLEEPLPNTLILLLTQQISKLLPTIRSRCQLIRLPIPTENESLHWLQQHPLQNDPQELLRFASNKPLLAIELDSTNQLLHQREWLDQLAQLLQGKKSIVELSTYWEKHDREQLLDWQLSFINTLFKVEYSYYSDKYNDYKKGSDIFNRLISKSKLWELQTSLLELKRFAIHPLNPRTTLEFMLSLWIKST